MKGSSTASAWTSRPSRRSLRPRPWRRKRSRWRMKVRLAFTSSMFEDGKRESFSLCPPHFPLATCCLLVSLSVFRPLQMCLLCARLQNAVYRRCISATCATTPALRMSEWGTTAGFITPTSLIGELNALRSPKYNEGGLISIGSGGASSRVSATKSICAWDCCRAHTNPPMEELLHGHFSI